MILIVATANRSLRADHDRPVRRIAVISWSHAIRKPRLDPSLNAHPHIRIESGILEGRAISSCMINFAACSRLARAERTRANGRRELARS